MAINTTYNNFIKWVFLASKVRHFKLYLHQNTVGSNLIFLITTLYNKKLKIIMLNEVPIAAPFNPRKGINKTLKNILEIVLKRSIKKVFFSSPTIINIE